MHYVVCFQPQWLGRKEVCVMSGSKYGAQNDLLINLRWEIIKKPCNYYFSNLIYIEVIKNNSSISNVSTHITLRFIKTLSI